MIINNLRSIFLVFAVSVVMQTHVLAQTTNTYQFVGKKFFVNGQPFLIKGVDDSLYPISTFPTEFGACYYDVGTSANGCAPAPGINIYEVGPLVSTELYLSSLMLANTYRTYGKIVTTATSSPLLQYANQYGMKVIAGYWVNSNIDFTFPGTSGQNQRQAMINDFVAYVNQLKADPNYSAVSMIGLSNEMNLHWCESVAASNQVCPGTACTTSAQDQQALGFYQLAEAMAAAAKLNDPNPRPIIIVSADLGDIGNAVRGANDTNLSHIDAWGINVYRGNTVTNLFSQFAGLTAKPMVVTEFGADAWDRTPQPPDYNGAVDEATQALWDGALWDLIKAEYLLPNGVVAGGIVFQLADNWWQAPGDIWTIGAAQHNSGGFDGPFPDKKADVEYFGLFSRYPSGAPFFDGYFPRQAAYTMYNKFSQP